MSRPTTVKVVVTGGPVPAEWAAHPGGGALRPNRDLDVLARAALLATGRHPLGEPGPWALLAVIDRDSVLDDALRATFGDAAVDDADATLLASPGCAVALGFVRTVPRGSG